MFSNELNYLRNFNESSFFTTKTTSSNNNQNERLIVDPVYFKSSQKQKFFINSNNNKNSLKEDTITIKKFDYDKMINELKQIKNECEFYRKDVKLQ